MLYLIQNDRQYDYDVRAIALAFFEREKIQEISDQELPEEQTHRIVQRRLINDYSYEIYSHLFVTRLCGIAGVPAQYVYKLTGSTWVEGRIAVFPLDSLERLANDG